MWEIGRILKLRKKVKRKKERKKIDVLFHLRLVGEKVLAVFWEIQMGKLNVKVTEKWRRTK